MNEPMDSSWPVDGSEDDCWPIAAGSQLVQTPHGIVVAFSPARAREPYAIMHLIHGGRMHVRQLGEHRSPRELERLAKKWAVGVAEMGTRTEKGINE